LDKCSLHWLHTIANLLVFLPHKTDRYDKGALHCIVLFLRETCADGM